MPKFDTSPEAIAEALNRWSDGGPANQISDLLFAIAHERDELASKLAEADALAKHYEKCCDSYADENQKFHDRFTSAESALTAANAEIARLKERERDLLLALEPYTVKPPTAAMSRC